MITGAFAQKLGMTHIYDNNRHIPVTVLKVTPQVVTGIRTMDKDKYTAIQIGTIGSKHVNKPQREELKKNSIDLAIDHRTELQWDGEGHVNIGDTIDANLFATGDKVTVTSVSKGKGFAGGIKRFGWSRGPMSHGSKHHRAPGSIGSGYPQRVVPGKKMPGHMGHVRVTTQGLKVMAINPQDNTIAIKGAVPGANKTFVLINKAGT